MEEADILIKHLNIIAISLFFINIIFITSILSAAFLFIEVLLWIPIIISIKTIKTLQIVDNKCKTSLNRFIISQGVGLVFYCVFAILLLLVPTNPLIPIINEDVFDLIFPIMIFSTLFLITRLISWSAFGDYIVEDVNINPKYAKDINSGINVLENVIGINILFLGFLIIIFPIYQIIRIITYFYLVGKIQTAAKRFRSFKKKQQQLIPNAASAVQNISSNNPRITSDQLIPKAPQTGQVFCPWCGKRIPANSEFCPNCGDNVAEIIAPLSDTGKGRIQSNSVSTSTSQIQSNVDIDPMDYHIKKKRLLKRIKIYEKISTFLLTIFIISCILSFIGIFLDIFMETKLSITSGVISFISYIFFRIISNEIDNAMHEKYIWDKRMRERERSTSNKEQIENIKTADKS